ncbi:MAG TPA: hypothetical protein VJH22_00970 [Candidatus Nanoarchaeia archaeon]|nr:hypothetical protein [Candidatus Nanoarchaeia archaeon]
MASVESSPDFEQASQLCEINGKVAYLFKEIMGKVFVRFGDKTYGPYNSATFTHPFKGGIAYCAQEKAKWAVFVDGKKASAEYDDLAAPILELDGHPVFTARTKDGWSIIKDNQVLAGPYPLIVQIRKHNNAIVTAVRKTDGKMCLITVSTDGKVAEGQSYLKISSPIVVNNKLVYGANKGEDTQVVVYDNQEVAVYEEIGRLMELKGKLVVTARKSEHEWVVSYDGREHGPYSLIGLVTHVGGKLIHAAMDLEDPKWHIYIDGVKQASSSSQGIGWLTEINGELGYVSLSKNQWCQVHLGDKLMGNEYLSVKLLTHFETKPVFAAAFGKEVQRWKVSIAGEEVTPEFTDILALVPIKDELFALAVKATLRHVVLKIK